MRAKVETGRVCAICGRRKSPKEKRFDTYGAHSTLKRLGIEGDKVHPDCLNYLLRGERK